MKAVLLVGMCVLGSMSIGAGLGLEGWIANMLLINGGFMFGVAALICVEDLEQEEN
jgi:hypothetical protein